MKIISILTPCYNEESNVYNMYIAIKEVMASLPQYSYEHLFIDNCSNDGTKVILRQIANEDKRVKVIFNERNFGPNRSGAYGMYQTSGDASICLPCDFQEPPELIPDFIEKWESGYKVVFGKKTQSEESKFMYGIRSLYYKIIKNFSDVPQLEQTTGFGIYDREVVERLRTSGEPTPNFRNLIAEYGYEVFLIEYKQQERASGKSKYTFWSYLDAAIESLVNTSKFPIRLSTYLGIIGMLCGFLGGLIYVITALVLGNYSGMGFNLLLVAIFIACNLQLCFVGMVGEYVAEILVRTKSRPMVVENQRLNFSEDEQR